VVLDLSSFKCGHDAPVYGLIDGIIETSKTPYAALHDIDANKPSGSIKIRVKTYAHALKLHEERLQDTRKRKGELEHAIDRKRLELLTLRTEQMQARQQMDPAIEKQISDVKERIRVYETRKTQVLEPGEATKGLIQLRKKSADGGLMPADRHVNRPVTSAAE
jgi:predicted  nucleic acid-binding Zn-ribbon protein